MWVVGGVLREYTSEKITIVSCFRIEKFQFWSELYHFKDYFHSAPSCVRSHLSMLVSKQSQIFKIFSIKQCWDLGPEVSCCLEAWLKTWVWVWGFDPIHCCNEYEYSLEFLCIFLVLLGPLDNRSSPHFGDL